jgi:3-deoxy-D-manno-octulosonic-acid transferase
VWPVLAVSAARGGVPVALVAATLPEESGRRGWAGRRFLRPAFRALARLCAVSERDGERFLELGVDPKRVVVTGDPGIDSAWERAAAADPEAPHLAAFHRSPRPTLVAGSTWPADERVLVPALTALRRAVPDLRVVVAPHEPDEAHLGSLEGALVAEGWRPLRLAQVEAAGDAGQADAVVVDRVGVLAHLYTVGRVAYVGGGFHRHGLHSVLEPAAAGIPVIFGPRFGSSLAAEELRDRGGAAAVKDAEELARVAASWLSGSDQGTAVGRRARAFLEEHRGASGRTVEALLPLLP